MKLLKIIISVVLVLYGSFHAREAVARQRKFTIKAAVDVNFVRMRHDWAQEVKRRFNSLSQIFEMEFDSQIIFVPDKTPVVFDSSDFEKDSKNDNSDKSEDNDYETIKKYIFWLKEKVIPKYHIRSDITVFFHYNFPPLQKNKLTGYAYYFDNVILINDLPKKQRKCSFDATIVHEMGHIFGARHSDDRSSYMFHKMSRISCRKNLHFDTENYQAISITAKNVRLGEIMPIKNKEDFGEICKLYNSNPFPSADIPEDESEVWLNPLAWKLVFNANKEFTGGNFESALELFSSALECRPNWSKALLGKAWCLRFNGMPIKALETYKNAYEFGDSNKIKAAALLEQINLSKQLGKYSTLKKAEEILKKNHDLAKAAAKYVCDMPSYNFNYIIDSLMKIPHLKNAALKCLQK